MTDDILTRRQLIGATSVVFLGGVSGCSSILDDINATAPESDAATDKEPQASLKPPAASESDSTSESDDTAESDDDSEPTPSESDDESEPTPSESWTQPETPNQPTEDKREGRINDVDIINKKEAGGGGYTDFDLQAGANTWLQDVDPEPEVDGDPYFAVEINGTLVARTDPVPFRKQGSFKIPIEQGALQQFESGTLEIRILLLDVDKQTDDLYGEWTGTIEYQPA